VSPLTFAVVARLPATEGSYPGLHVASTRVFFQGLLGSELVRSISSVGVLRIVHLIKTEDVRFVIWEEVVTAMLNENCDGFYFFPDNGKRALKLRD